MTVPQGTPLLSSPTHGAAGNYTCRRLLTWQARFGDLGTSADSGHHRALRCYCAHRTLAAPTFTTTRAMAHGVVLSLEVREALASGRPVVALESAVITHDMSYPQNLATALELEAVVRDHGAVPATIAVVSGVPRAGLTDIELEALAAKGPTIRKTSVRDLPVVVAKGLDGATTVAATAFLAASAGIRVVVAGGIGGVQRGGELSMDISADLNICGSIPVMVVCAGAKSVLDIKRTLEYLETQGVCVTAYGADEFPAFFVPKSGCVAPARVESPSEAANLLHSSMQLKLSSGLVLGVPIAEERAATGEKIDVAAQKALKESAEKKLEGPEQQLFLLERVRELTDGASLELKIEIIKRNAGIGAEVAVSLCKLLERSELHVE